MRPALFAALMLSLVPMARSQVEPSQVARSQVEPAQLEPIQAAPIQTPASTSPADSDHDGLSDALENALLAQFAPHFMISGHDCSTRPAQFIPFLDQPVVNADNGTIYGQATPHAGTANPAGTPQQVELHYYHLWRADCGQMSHYLDTEHVSALVERDADAHWKALYWYAAAHEDTVCDASQIVRASAAAGRVHGPQVWISWGKHGSFLSDDLCPRGCGGDVCRASEPLAIAQIINLGERSAPMNGSTWIDSTEWPLALKMSRSDFTPARMARADSVSAPGIVWANPGKKPVQAAILGGNDAFAGTATGVNATGSALDTAHADTGNALDKAAANTGKGLAKSLHAVKKALGSS